MSNYGARILAAVQAACAAVRSVLFRLDVRRMSEAACHKRAPRPAAKGTRQSCSDYFSTKPNGLSWPRRVLAVQSAWLGLLLLLPRPVAAEDARLPYHDIYRIQKAQAELSRKHTNLALVLQMRSTLPDVKYSDIKASVDAKSGAMPVLIGADGVFSVPLRDDLLAEDPWIVVNQPRGTMQLNWHAGLSPALARQVTNDVHYGPVMRAVRDCDDVQEAMRQYFPAAPRLTAVGLRLTFRSTTIGAAAIIHAKTGDRRLAADTLGELIIPLDADLLDENPVITLTENPIAVEIVTRKTDGGP
jgi:hypothetical protein